VTGGLTAAGVPVVGGGGGRRTYTEDELQAALRDIQSGKLGTRRAAVLYGIPRSTLRNKVYKLAMERERDASLSSGANAINSTQSHNEVAGATGAANSNAHGPNAAARAADASIATTIAAITTTTTTTTTTITTPNTIRQNAATPQVDEVGFGDVTCVGPSSRPRTARPRAHASGPGGSYAELTLAPLSPSER
jgi:hypothetical protein